MTYCQLDKNNVRIYTFSQENAIANVVCIVPAIWCPNVLSSALLTPCAVKPMSTGFCKERPVTQKDTEKGNKNVRTPTVWQSLKTPNSTISLSSIDQSTQGPLCFRGCHITKEGNCSYVSLSQTTTWPYHSVDFTYLVVPCRDEVGDVRRSHGHADPGLEVSACKANSGASKRERRQRGGQRRYNRWGHVSNSER